MIHCKKAVTVHGLFLCPERNNIMYYPSCEQFEELARKGNLIPLYREILTDRETPVSVLTKLKTRSHVFLLESVEGGEKWGRYTFLGTDPRKVFRVRGDDVIVHNGNDTRQFSHGGDPLSVLRALMSGYRPVPVDGLPRFSGGAVGFFAYDMVRYFETLPHGGSRGIDTDEAVFLITDTLLIFDNVKHTIKVVAAVCTDGVEDLRTAYAEGTKKIDRLVDIIMMTAAGKAATAARRADPALRSTLSPDEFRSMVAKAKDYIVAGDIIQVVLSQRFETDNGIDPVDLYRALRYINPSPYLFYLKMDDLVLIGSSPEVMVRLDEGVVELRPIAGTRKRGRTEQEDRMLADELLQDEKERAEHIMLVDLGRNDLGRIARTGSIQVNQLMTVERYSHVMHLVSNIRAQLDPQRDAFDVIRASFPAGTLSGAPKVRAMEIIDELECVRRGPYGGAVGYVSFTGNMDLGITIRTIVVKGTKLYIQTGAGIVADSDPSAEYDETVNKARAMMEAIRLAAADFDISCLNREDNNDCDDR
jgi:anthranilate synthase component 1